MLLDDCEFLFRKATGVLKHAVGNTDFSHVVEQGADTDTSISSKASCRADAVAQEI
jgi:hypothetical protein